jgi:hypothetical protein
MLSPGWIQNSLAKKAKASLPRSRLSAPTFDCHSVALAVPAAPPMTMAAAANETTDCEIMFLTCFILFLPGVRLDVAAHNLKAGKWNENRNEV